MHLLYARFITKALKDLKFIDSESIEPENYGLSRKDFDKYIWLIQSDQKKIKGVFQRR